jgi:hypothetical protein
VKGHSIRHGRSRCTSKVGPGRRSHKKRSVVRRQGIRDTEAGGKWWEMLVIVDDREVRREEQE